MRRTLHWKRSRISIFDVEVIPHRFIPLVQTGLSIALYMRILLLVKSFYFRPNSQCIFCGRHSLTLPFRECVFVISKSLVEVQLKILDIVLLTKVYIVYMERWAGFSVHVKWADLDSLAFILHFFNHISIASRLFCSYCEAMSGSLSVANTAVSSANVAVVDSVEVGRSAVYSRYNSGPRTLTWSTPAMTGESSVYSDSTLTSKCLPCK
jgi:hypothetical protein